MVRVASALFLVAVLTPFAGSDEPPAVDPVEKALKYLATQQQPTAEFRTTVGQHRVAPTGLVVLAFLSAGVKPDDATFGAKMRTAVAYLLSCQDKDGVFREPFGSTTMYSHGLATWALAEYAVAAGNACPPAVKPALERAVALLAKSQSPRGGWRYEPRPADGDMSITSWQWLALRAAARAKCDVPEKTLDGCRAFLESCRRKDAGFAYVPLGGNPTPACTASGLLHLLLDGAPADRDDVAALRKVVLGQQAASNYVLYTKHYQAQALARFEGKDAEAGLDAIRDAVLKLRKDDGSFAQEGTERSYGPVYATALAVLTLTAKDRRLAVMRPAPKE